MISLTRSIRPIRLINRPPQLCRSNSTIAEKFWRWTTTPRPEWKKDMKEGIIAVCIFGITGSSTVAFIRPTISSLFGIEGSLIDGPNSYRVMSLLFISPCYAIMLMLVGTIGGRHLYFAKMSAKILRRFLPNSKKDLIYCPGKHWYK